MEPDLYDSSFWDLEDYAVTNTFDPYSNLPATSQAAPSYDWTGANLDLATDGDLLSLQQQQDDEFQDLQQQQPPPQPRQMFQAPEAQAIEFPVSATATGLGRNIQRQIENSRAASGGVSGEDDAPVSGPKRKTRKRTPAKPAPVTSATEGSTWNLATLASNMMINSETMKKYSDRYRKEMRLTETGKHAFISWKPRKKKETAIIVNPPEFLTKMTVDDDADIYKTRLNYLYDFLDTFTALDQNAIREVCRAYAYLYIQYWDILDHKSGDENYRNEIQRKVDKMVNDSENFRQTIYPDPIEGIPFAEDALLLAFLLFALRAQAGRNRIREHTVLGLVSWVGTLNIPGTEGAKRVGESPDGVVFYKRPGRVSLDPQTYLTYPLNWSELYAQEQKTQTVSNHAGATVQLAELYRTNIGRPANVLVWLEKNRVALRQRVAKARGQTKAGWDSFEQIVAVNDIDQDQLYNFVEVGKRVFPVAVDRIPPLATLSSHSNPPRPRPSKKRETMNVPPQVAPLEARPPKPTKSKKNVKKDRPAQARSLNVQPPVSRELDRDSPLPSPRSPLTAPAQSAAVDSTTKKHGNGGPRLKFTPRNPPALLETNAAWNFSDSDDDLGGGDDDDDETSSISVQTFNPPPLESINSSNLGTETVVRTNITAAVTGAGAYSAPVEVVSKLVDKSIRDSMYTYEPPKDAIKLTRDILRPIKGSNGRAVPRFATPEEDEKTRKAVCAVGSDFIKNAYQVFLQSNEIAKMSTMVREILKRGGTGVNAASAKVVDQCQGFLDEYKEAVSTSAQSNSAKRAQQARRAFSTRDYSSASWADLQVNCLTYSGNLLYINGLWTQIKSGLPSNKSARQQQQPLTDLAVEIQSANICWNLEYAAEFKDTDLPALYMIEPSLATFVHHPDHCRHCSRQVMSNLPDQETPSVVCECHTEEAPWYYCSENCKEADSYVHKNGECRLWQLMGTRPIQKTLSQAAAESGLLVDESRQDEEDKLTLNDLFHLTARLAIKKQLRRNLDLKYSENSISDAADIALALTPRASLLEAIDSRTGDLRTRALLAREFGLYDPLCLYDGYDAMPGSKTKAHIYIAAVLYGYIQELGSAAGLLEGVDLATLIRLCGIAATNAFEAGAFNTQLNAEGAARTQKILVGQSVFAVGSFFDHSCSPDFRWDEHVPKSGQPPLMVIAENLQHRIRTKIETAYLLSDKITAEASLMATLAYTSIFEDRPIVVDNQYVEFWIKPRLERCFQFMDIWGFSCTCVMCKASEPSAGSTGDWLAVKAEPAFNEHGASALSRNKRLKQEQALYAIYIKAFQYSLWYLPTELSLSDIFDLFLRMQTTLDYIHFTPEQASSVIKFGTEQLGQNKCYYELELLALQMQLNQIEPFERRYTPPMRVEGFEDMALWYIFSDAVIKNEHSKKVLADISKYTSDTLPTQLKSKFKTAGKVVDFSNMDQLCQNLADVFSITLIFSTLESASPGKPVVTKEVEWNPKFKERAVAAIALGYNPNGHLFVGLKVPPARTKALPK